MMPNALTVSYDLDKARRDLDDTSAAMRSYFGRDTSDVGGQMDDVRAAIEGLTRALSSATLAIERLAALPACDGGHDGVSDWPERP